MKVARAFVPAKASSDRVAARAGVALVQRRFVGAVAKAHALGYKQVVHDAVDFIKSRYVCVRGHRCVNTESS